jgi:hypothetical protein
MCWSSCLRSSGCQLFEFLRPEAVEGLPQGGHARGIEPVVTKPPLSPDLHQPCICQNPEVLRNRRPRDAEPARELRHRLLARGQQVEQSPSVRLRQHAHQIGHHNTLAKTNTLCHNFNLVLDQRPRSSTRGRPTPESPQGDDGVARPAPKSLEAGEPLPAPPTGHVGRIPTCFSTHVRATSRFGTRKDGDE